MSVNDSRKRFAMAERDRDAEVSRRRQSIHAVV
jgi:hypothetical protein